jgi:hypothetical protein
LTKSLKIALEKGRFLIFNIFANINHPFAFEYFSTWAGDNSTALLALPAAGHGFKLLANYQGKLQHCNSAQKGKPRPLHALSNFWFHQN